MRKALLVTATVFAVLTIILVAFRLSGRLQYYKVVSASGLPVLKPGDRVFASTLIAPKRFDLVSYYHHDSSGYSIYLYRLCGLPGDIVAMKQGRLYVNGEAADSKLRLMHRYLIGEKDFRILQSKDLIREDQVLSLAPGNGFLVNIEDKIAGQLPGAVLFTDTTGNEWTRATYGQEWSIDNFGPVKVPAGKIFVLGDNRHDAMDSRYTGFVAEADIAGVLIGK